MKESKTPNMQLSGVSFVCVLLYWTEEVPKRNSDSKITLLKDPLAKVKNFKLF